MSAAIARAQLRQIAESFALVGAVRVEFPPEKYEALRAAALDCDMFGVKLEAVDGRYVERVTVNIVIDGVTFCATKTTPTAMYEVAS